MDEQISKKAALVAVKDALMAWSYMPEWRDEKILEAIAELPPAEPELIKCDYVKACNEVTMNKTFSAWRYLAMLDDFEEYGYVLVKRRANS